MRTSTARLASLTVASLLLLAATPADAHHRAGHGSGGTTGTDYVLPVWFNWDQTDLDVIVVPPDHGQVFNGNGVLNGLDPDEANPYANSYMDAILDSIQAWKTGIAKHSPSLASSLTIDVYVLGQDDIPASVLLDPEIVITAMEEMNAYLGVAVNTLVPDCVVSNTKFFVLSFTYADMYNINAQEFGHCLGLDHVVNNNPPHDPMAGLYVQTPGRAGNTIYCISNLDVMALEEVFSGGSVASISSSSYGC